MKVLRRQIDDPILELLEAPALGVGVGVGVGVGGAGAGVGDT